MNLFHVFLPFCRVEAFEAIIRDLNNVLIFFDIVFLSFKLNN